MKILFVSAEVAPFAKVGGLADVAGSLPKALRKLGHDVRIVTPFYGMVRDDPRWRIETVAPKVPISINGGWSTTASIAEGELDGVPIYFIGHPRFFAHASESRDIYTPGIEQYLFFSVAALSMSEALGWKPDVIHCNDWHTGMIPVLLRERFAAEGASIGSVFSIHNLAYQGEFGVEILDALALPRSLFVPEKLETWGGVNFLKSGCVYSDRVTTVSPTYAKEIQTAEYGHTLHGLMSHLAAEGRLSGILNGIDEHEFNPAHDPNLPFHYSAGYMNGKAKNRAHLLQQVGLTHREGAPLVGMVTRLSVQKGLDLLISAAPDLFSLGFQFVVQGLGDPAIAAGLRELEKAFPDSLRFVERFDEDLARNIYAGSDLFAMPSLFEPCGLGQMIAMRYGSIPVVRATGGLADTVTEGQNGFVFSAVRPSALVDAMSRAKTVFERPAEWASLVRRAMAEDHGWAAGARRYVELYEATLRLWGRVGISV